MNHIIVKGEVCYADEFDCEAIFVTTQEKWDSICEKTERDFNGSVEVCFGTNEYMEFASYEDWIQNFKVCPISEATYNELKLIFPRPFGTGAHMFHIRGYM